MFGRRNPDHPTINISIPPHESERPLDLLPELPDLSPLTTHEPCPPHPTPEHLHHIIHPENTLPPHTPAKELHPHTAPVAPNAPPSITTMLPHQHIISPPLLTESVIGPDDFFDGNYRSERGVRIQGQARGSIESRQSIFVEPGAHVTADLTADNISIAGMLNGTIICRHRLEITSTGTIRGHVQTPLLIVHEGGILEGELRMEQDTHTATP